MKTKIISLIVLALIAIFPFRYAYLDDETPSAFNILCMVAIVFGTLIFMLVNLSDDNKYQNNNETRKHS
jgi:hypothetical protein